MEENYFATSDLDFSCFLKANGIDLREVQMDDPAHNQCSFVFRIDKYSEELSKLKREWDFSTKAREIKRVLFANKMLKKELKLFLTKYHSKKYSLEDRLKHN